MLKPQPYTFYSANELKPQGWLLRQLRIQADGLCGNLDKVWPDIRESKWIGGQKEGWERVPYWLDGFIPMAWLLEDADLQTRATAFIDAILARQQPDGWLCPCKEEERARYDVWAVFLICKVLTVYHDCTGDERIKPAVTKALKCLSLHMERHTLFDWASARWFECLIPIFWLYQRCPEEWLLDLAHALHVQGMDYRAMFETFRFQHSQGKDRWNFMTHVVNLAMCLKAESLFGRVSGDDGNTYAQNAFRLLMKHHGMPVGHFTGDECLSGTSPIQGSECCSVVEAMYSYEWLLALTGDPSWADRLEKLAYNALPATLGTDCWTHQYDQMTNQVQCTRLEEEHTVFRTNSGESHLFGLEPNFGCCTANFGQGWPKLALSTLMKRPDGIAVGAIAPCSLSTSINGVGVACVVETNYPFEDSYMVRITTQAPVAFALELRVPERAHGVTLDGTPVSGPQWITQRLWEGRTEVQVSFRLEAELMPHKEGLYFAQRGSLVFALPILAESRRLEYTRDGVERKFPYCDYELTPVSQWNYSFADAELKLRTAAWDGTPFSPEQPPVLLTAHLAPVDWPLEHGVCAEQPRSAAAIGPIQELDLIPYGCTDLRMTAMPMTTKTE